MKIFPRRVVLYLFLIPLPLFVIGFWVKNFILLGLGINICIIFLILFDLFISPNLKKKVIIKIIQPTFFKMNSYNKIKIKIENKNKLSIHFNMLLDLNIAFDRRYSEKVFVSQGNSSREEKIKIFARRRGEFISKFIFIKVKSFLGLLSIYQTYKQKINITVLPKAFFINSNFKIIKKLIQRAKGNQKTRIIGNGADFEMLRDYTKGDPFNRIDWKATSRKRKLITRVYQMQNVFEVFLMLDCGRISSTEVNGKSMLDYAIDSLLLLSYSAIKNNDHISFMAFGTKIIKHISRIKNLTGLKKLNAYMSKINSEMAESNYQSAFSFVKQNLKKRSLIVFFTDIIDDSGLNIYKKYLYLLNKKHIIIIVLLRDKNLFTISNTQAKDDLTIHQIIAANDLVLRRNKTIHELKKTGIIILDLYPEDVTPNLLNKYINIKHNN